MVEMITGKSSWAYTDDVLSVKLGETVIQKRSQTASMVLTMRM